MSITVPVTEYIAHLITITVIILIYISKVIVATGFSNEIRTLKYRMIKLKLKIPKVSRVKSSIEITAIVLISMLEVILGYGLLATMEMPPNAATLIGFIYILYIIYYRYKTYNMETQIIQYQSTIDESEITH